MPSIATPVINFSQEFTVTEDGIEFQSFVFWRIFVPWEEIVSLKDSYIPWGKYHIVITDRLMLLHRVIGAIHGLTLKPAFIFNKGLINYDEAVEIILQKLNARQH
ncbi:MAG: hypothetical protein IH859_02620 [Chloroflexi bacterium]|nr:hypothetical protein [Chloroflexota bacterium]